MASHIPMSEVPKKERRRQSSCLIWHWSPSSRLLYCNNIEARLYYDVFNPLCTNAYYIFDSAYDSFKVLYRIHLPGSIFVVRTKTNLKYTMVKWKRSMPKYVLTEADIKQTGYLSEKNITSHSDSSFITMKNMTVSSLYWRTQHIFLHRTLPISIRKDSWSSYYSNG